MEATLSPNIRRQSKSRDSLIKDAHILLGACGVVRSPAWVARTVRNYLASPITEMPFGIFLFARVELNAVQRRKVAERADLRYLLTYADPTGETAVRNLMRGGVSE